MPGLAVEHAKHDCLVVIARLLLAFFDSGRGCFTHRLHAALVHVRNLATLERLIDLDRCAFLAAQLADIAMMILFHGQTDAMEHVPC